MAWITIELLYEQFGRSMLTDDNAVIAAGDIGALGYYYGARFMDTLGLISAKSVDYYQLVF